MALVFRELTLRLSQKEAELPAVLAHELNLSTDDICRCDIVRRGIDARRKPDVRRVYSLRFEVDDEDSLLKRLSGERRLSRYQAPSVPQPSKVKKKTTALVVGMGPAGLFAALALAKGGAKVDLIDRGQPLERRVKAVNRFWASGVLDPESNVQFGEGGAGTFSDGKLTTRVKNPWNRWVLQTLIDCGAPDRILFEAKPHVGTDRLRLVLIRLRQELVRLGVSLHYETRLDDLILHNDRVVGGRTADGKEFMCDALVFAPGHSARDTYAWLDQLGVKMEAKPFAVGARVEHPTSLINRIQYGQPSHPALPAAEYSLAWNDPHSERGVYSFCMCPGGEVILSSSEPESVVVNGMSRLKRDSDYANSALVVSVRPEDFPGKGPLAGMRFQQHWENAAYVAGGSRYWAPAQNMMDFLGRAGQALRSTVRPGVKEADMAECLPDFVVNHLRQGLPHFDRRMKGFISQEATLVGIESRTSAPVRILRDEQGQSVTHPGLFPTGEGAGYAGGIMSAALDGLRAAEQVAMMTGC